MEMTGLKPVVFQNPASLWDAFLAAQPRPRLLVTDYVMRPFNGMELIERCKGLEPNLKTILFSGSVDESISARHAVQPDHFFRKPLKLQILMEAVRSLLSQ
jgi:DNA-binding NtrC family response regulator